MLGSGIRQLIDIRKNALSRNYGFAGKKIMTRICAKWILSTSIQYDLFDDTIWRKMFQIVQKPPYGFFYRFKDADGRPSKLRSLDWELGALSGTAGGRGGDDGGGNGEVVRPAMA
ncbi:MAG: hypothetical protein TH68_05405, partial [Candidatus Synechococcus spongiarum 142]